MRTNETILTKQGREFYGHNPARKAQHSEERTNGTGCAFPPWIDSFFGSSNAWYFPGKISSCTHCHGILHMLASASLGLSPSPHICSRNQNTGSLRAENTATEAALAQRKRTAYPGTSYQASGNKRACHRWACSWAPRFLHSIPELARSRYRTVLLISCEYPFFFCSSEPARGNLVSCSV